MSDTVKRTEEADDEKGNPARWKTEAEDIAQWGKPTVRHLPVEDDETEFPADK